MLKSEIKKLLNFNGETRGSGIITDRDYILENYGKKGIKKVEKKMKEYGVNFKLKEIRSTGWYNTGQRILFLIAVKEVFNLSNNDISKMGYNSTKLSFLVRILARVSPSIKIASKSVASGWRKHNTKGDIEIKYKNDNDVIVIFKNFNPHPIIFDYIKGFLKGITEFVEPNKKIKVIKSKKLDYHEFLIKTF